MKRNQFNKEFKAKAAVAAIKGQSTANELAQEYEVHVSQINLWKKQLLEAAPTVFGRSGEREGGGSLRGTRSSLRENRKTSDGSGLVKKRRDISVNGGRETCNDRAGQS